MLVGCGVTDPAQLASIPPTQLLERVESFLTTESGQRILHTGSSHELSRITTWIATARASAPARRGSAFGPGKVVNGRVVQNSDGVQHSIDHDQNAFQTADLARAAKRSRQQQVAARHGTALDASDGAAYGIVSAADNDTEFGNGNRTANGNGLGLGASRGGFATAIDTERPIGLLVLLVPMVRQMDPAMDRAVDRAVDREWIGSWIGEWIGNSIGQWWRSVAIIPSLPPPSLTGRSATARVASRESADLRRERRDREARERNPQSASETELRFFLHRESPVVDAPSIGAKMAERLSGIGIETVDDLLNADPESVAEELDHRRVDAETIEAWQHQATLVCGIPMLRGHGRRTAGCSRVHDPEGVRIGSDKLFAVIDPISQAPKANE